VKEKKKLKNRRLVISTLIIIALLSLSTVIIYQYNQYNQIERRLNAAYSSNNHQSSTLYKLFSTFSEADYLFRIYAINFNVEDYTAYALKLDTVKNIIDSLAALPIDNNQLKGNDIYNSNLTTEYLILKKQVDNLVFYAKDSIASQMITQSTERQGKSIKTTVYPNSLLNNTIIDSTTKTVKKDTIVKKKESFFKRVFKSKDDTLVTDNNVEIHNTQKMNLVFQKNLQQITESNNKIYKSNLKELKSSFEKLKHKERELVFSNLILLNNLKNGIEHLRLLEFNNRTKNQEADFLIYTQNTETIRNQLIIALSLMVLMIILIIGYQRQVFFYERKLIKEKEYADTIAEEKTSILADISHEIRTPLNSLKGLVNILKNNTDDNIIDKAIIQSVDHDITVINSSINDILSLSKLESDSTQIKNEYLNIHTIIEDLIGLHVFQAENKGLTLRNNNQLKESTLILSNSFRIKQVISNLITNAIKYTDKGQITVTSQIRNNTLVVTVEDTGIGIKAEDTDQIFRKYYVADSKSKAGGFGLGLYISKVLTEQIDAKLYFKSNFGKGTIFTFELPIKGIKESLIKKQASYTISDIPTDLNIVFVDDSKINLFFVQQLFKNQKNVHLFMDGKQALEYITSHPVDIIVTDLKMPKVSGWDILDAIKSNSSLAHIKVIVATAEPLLLEYGEGEYHFDGAIYKPIKENELVATIINYSSIG